MSKSGDDLQDLVTHFMHPLPALAGPNAFIKKRIVSKSKEPSIEQTLREALAPKKKKQTASM